MVGSGVIRSFISGCLVIWVVSGCGQGGNQLQLGPLPVADSVYYREFLQLLSNQIESSPNNTNLRIKLAGYHQAMKWPEGSEANLRAILVQAPQDARAMMLAADFYIHQSDFEKSWVYAQQAERAGAAHPSLYLIKSRYHYSKRDYAEASRLLDHYFKLGGKLSEAFLLGAEIRLVENDTLQAIEVLERGVKEGFGDIRIVELLSSIHSAQQNLSALIKLLESFQNRTNNTLTFRHTLIKSYFTSKSYSKATELASSWPEESENGFFVYGSLFLGTNMSDSAATYATRILEKDSADTDGLLLLARYEARRGRNAEASRLYAALLDIDPAHQIALSEKDIVTGKIAYLRKIKAQQAAMPVFDIAPKKN